MGVFSNFQIETLENNVNKKIQTVVFGVIVQEEGIKRGRKKLEEKVKNRPTYSILVVSL
jgi:lipopolysaccharide biosynthesis regulator YciM